MKKVEVTWSTPVAAIRNKCLDCAAGSRHEVRHCPVDSCALWPYRFGSRPETHIKYEGTLSGTPCEPGENDEQASD